MGVLESGVFTQSVTNDTLTITESMGVKRVSIFNASAVTGTAAGGQALGALSSAAVNIAEDDTLTVDAIEASVIKELTITSPSGCTLTVIAIV